MNYSSSKQYFDSHGIIIDNSLISANKIFRLFYNIRNEMKICGIILKRYYRVPETKVQHTRGKENRAVPRPFHVYFFFGIRRFS